MYTQREDHIRRVLGKEMITLQEVIRVILKNLELVGSANAIGIVKEQVDNAILAHDTEIKKG